MNSNATPVTFWHSGIDLVIAGVLTGEKQPRMEWICEGWHETGTLVEILWEDANGRAGGHRGLMYRTWVPLQNVLHTGEAV